MSHLRPAVIGLQVIATLAAMEALGSLAAASYENSELAQARSAVEKAHHSFGARVATALADGTDRPLLAPIIAEETRLHSAPAVAPTYFVDTLPLQSLQQRARKLRTLSGQVDGVEVQVELALSQQIEDALGALRGDFGPATAVGVDTGDARKFADDIEAHRGILATPNRARALLDTITARQHDLRSATASRVAARQTLQLAQADAHAALGKAQSALTQARAIPVLKVDDAATAINALAAQLATAVMAADYESIATQLWAQTATLNTMLRTRQQAYDLLTAARAHLARAQQGGIDVAALGRQLDAAAQTLDQASDLGSIKTAKDQVQSVKNAIDVKYNLAVYGPGRVFVISVQLQELEALQDGVVELDTLVTTGRPSLPSPVGTWSIMAKYSPYHMVSPWPPGNRYYYPPTWIKYAMLWHDGGYFIHDAPWRYHYGPGSDTEYGGTHGCVNVPSGAIQWLYHWGQVGDKVVTLAGEF